LWRSVATNSTNSFGRTDDQGRPTVRTFQSNCLARVCQRLKVPRPPRGYWAQLAVGRAAARPSLPDPQPGDELEWSRDGRARRAAVGLPKAPESVRRRARVTRTASNGRHAALDDALEYFEGVRLTEGGYLKPRKKLTPDVFVSQATLQRAFEQAQRSFTCASMGGATMLSSPQLIATIRARPLIPVSPGGRRNTFGTAGRRALRPSSSSARLP